MASLTLDTDVPSQTTKAIAKHTNNPPSTTSPSRTSKASTYTKSTVKSQSLLPGCSEQIRLQMLWEKEIGHPTRGVCKQNTAVLLLSWEKGYDDLNTGPEVDKLADIFRRVYGYKVVPRKLEKHGMHSQVQVNQILANFVAEEDGKDTLLIIYYAGHGYAKDSKPGKLNLVGKQHTEADADEKNQIVWDIAENNLKLTQADVFVIFDCCYAGRLCHATRGKPLRTFEFLAACSEASTTCKPSSKSFTSALTWSLKELAKDERPFLSTELWRKIPHAPGFPQNQYPQLVNRLESSITHIVLAPSSASTSPRSAIPAEYQEIPDIMAEEYLDIRLYYDHALKDGDVINAAHALKNAKSGMKNPPRRIALRGKYPLSQAVWGPALHWLQSTREKHDRQAAPVFLQIPESQQSVNVEATVVAGTEMGLDGGSAVILSQVKEGPPSPRSERSSKRRKVKDSPL